MMDAIYTGLAGMQSYSQGLNVISNNVSNLNTVGFKLSTPLFEDVVYQRPGASVTDAPVDRSPGAGVQTRSEVTSFAEGQLESTNNPLDAAIDGNGLFVLNDSGTTLYTRAGQFEIDKDGNIVDTSTKATVLFTPAGGGAAAPLNVNAFQTDEPAATTTVNLVGNLSSDATTTTYDTPAVTVYDASGASQTVTVHFVRNATNPLQWTAEVHDAAGKAVGSQALTFNADGTPTADSLSVVGTITPKTGSAFKVTFNLGTAGTFTGVTDTANGGTASTVQSSKVDGQALGTLTTYQFTGLGELKATYSNGDTKTLGTLVLARFETPDQMKAVGNGAFVAQGGAQPLTGAPLNNGLGRVVGGQVEQSNVDLTAQFTALIIVQRGYQAGSQMVSTASEMMQQLIDMAKGR
jgi:flagellar hook protein FlgE